MTAMETLIEQLQATGTSSLGAFWLPLTAWTLMAVPVLLGLRLWRSGHPLVQYYAHRALLLALPLAFILAPVLPVPSFVPGLLSFGLDETAQAAPVIAEPTPAAAGKASPRTSASISGSAPRDASATRSGVASRPSAETVPTWARPPHSQLARRMRRVLRFRSRPTMRDSQPIMRLVSQNNRLHDIGRDACLTRRAAHKSDQV
jgi:hypothetical protein